MRKSKYYGKTFGNWQCIHIGIADVQPAFCRRKVDGKRVRSKSPGSKQYYYIFERLTSDNKAMKMIRLNAAQVRSVAKGLVTVEIIAAKKQSQKQKNFKDKVSYSFHDRLK